MWEEQTLEDMEMVLVLTFHPIETCLGKFARG